MTSERAELLRLLRLYGWNATAYQIVNPGFRRWFTREGVVAFVEKGRFRIVGGAPVCPKERLAEVVGEWSLVCKLAKRKDAYFGAAGRLEELLRSNPKYCGVVLGAQPVWNPQHWAAKFDSKPSLRAQVNRARNKGVLVTEWSTERATSSSALKKVLKQWLARRGLPPLHFLVEPETLDSLEDKRVFVAERSGEPVAFVTMAPVPTRKGWLTEQFVRGDKAPNGTIESVVDFAVRAVAKDGAEYLTMGLVPLSTVDPEWSRSNPWWLRLLAVWARAHGRRFYNFTGLEAFKTKFRPDEWEPIYAFSHQPRFTFAALYAIAAAFTAISPLRALAIGLGRAVRTELSRLQGRH